MVIAGPSASLAGELKELLPTLRQVVGEGRRVTVCFDRGGWSPALFADILEAGVELLTYRKGTPPEPPPANFTTINLTRDRRPGPRHELGHTTPAPAGYHPARQRQQPN